MFRKRRNKSGVLDLVTVINIALLLVNLYSVGVAEKKLSIIDEKLDDLAVIESQIKHFAESLDSAFWGV